MAGMGDRGRKKARVVVPVICIFHQIQENEAAFGRCTLQGLYGRAHVRTAKRRSVLTVIAIIIATVNPAQRVKQTTHGAIVFVNEGHERTLCITLLRFPNVFPVSGKILGPPDKITKSFFSTAVLFSKIVRAFREIITAPCAASF